MSAYLHLQVNTNGAWKNVMTFAHEEETMERVKQAAQALHGLRIGLAIAQQAVQIEAPAEVFDADTDAPVLDLIRGDLARPGLPDHAGEDLTAR